MNCWPVVGHAKPSTDLTKVVKALPWQAFVRGYSSGQKDIGAANESGGRKRKVHETNEKVVDDSCLDDAIHILFCSSRPFVWLRNAMQCMYIPHLS